MLCPLFLALYSIALVPAPAPAQAPAPNPGDGDTCLMLIADNITRGGGNF